MASRMAKTKKGVKKFAQKVLKGAVSNRKRIHHTKRRKEEAAAEGGKGGVGQAL